MMRVAYAAGRNEILDVRRAGHIGMTLGVGILIALIAVPLVFTDQIVRIFIHPADPGFAEVSELAAGFLMIAVIFQVFDGLQAIAARALRGIKDNLAPLWIAGFGYWVLGIGGGSLLAFYYDLGGTGLWWGLALGLSVTASLLCWRFNRLTSRPLKVKLAQS
jgi:MATE family multidrug resistance protein